MKHVNITLPLNGDSDEWNVWDEIEKPLVGELCVLKIVVDVQAYYIPECEVSKWLIKEVKEDINHASECTPLAWKPILDSKNYHEGKND